jgi:hypothetical protein
VTAFDELAAHLGTFRTAPYLFVGSGLSRRYLGLETWTALLARFAAMTDKPYAYYVTSANGHLPRVASVLAETFHDLWWADGRFEESRDQYADGRLTSREGPLKVEVSRHTAIALNQLPADGPLAEELELLGEAVIDGIITTNYDGLLESIFDDYRVYVGQDQLLFSDPQGVGEIYKIHGSHSDPESLVLTEADFARYRDRNPYLAAKLLTVFVEHPVLFVGYSLNDPNVQEILVSVARCLTTENLGRLRDRLIFISWDPDVREPTFTRSVISVEGFVIPTLNLATSDFTGVYRALGGIHRKFPARLLRQLKEHVYELVRSNEPQGHLFVQDINADTDLANVDVVFGVGTYKRLSSVGHVGLSRQQVLRDVLKRESDWEPSGLVREALPVLLQRHPTAHTPIYRYLRSAGLLNPDGTLVDPAAVDDRVAARVAEGTSRLEPARQAATRAKRILRDAGGTLGDVLNKVALPDALLAIPVVPPETFSLEELRAFLEQHQDALDTALASSWAKAVCFYDFHAYARDTVTAPASTETTDSGQTEEAT